MRILLYLITLFIGFGANAERLSVNGLFFILENQSSYQDPRQDLNVKSVEVLQDSTLRIQYEINGSVAINVHDFHRTDWSFSKRVYTDTAHIRIVAYDKINRVHLVLKITENAQNLSGKVISFSDINALDPFETPIYEAQEMVLKSLLILRQGTMGEIAHSYTEATSNNFRSLMHILNQSKMNRSNTDCSASFVTEQMDLFL